MYLESNTIEKEKIIEILGTGKSIKCDINKIKEDIYMEIPDGIKIDSESKKNKVCKLKKPIYGLRISPSRWNKRLSEVLLEIGLKRGIEYPYLFTYRKLGIIVIVIIYIDDMILIGNCLRR